MESFKVVKETQLVYLDHDAALSHEAFIEI